MALVSSPSLIITAVLRLPHHHHHPKQQVHGLPCFIMFKDGQEVEGSHSEGAMSKKALTEYLAKHGVVPVAANA